jgi:hypothetical protein
MNLDYMFNYTTQEEKDVYKLGALIEAILMLGAKRGKQLQNGKYGAMTEKPGISALLT